jgi:hypothetical protein
VNKEERVRNRDLGIMALRELLEEKTTPPDVKLGAARALLEHIKWEKNWGEGVG